MTPKYRAWKKAGKELGRVGQITFELDGSVSHVLFKGKFLDFNVPINEIILMQSTGLKDKNGKEIFEGDILACKTDDEVINLNIFWDEEHALFMFESKKYNEQEPLAELVENNTYPFEIIGNIYENPELLEDK